MTSPNDLPENCPECGEPWDVTSQAPSHTTKGDGWGSFVLHFDKDSPRAGRCKNGHGWPTDETAPHPYVPPKTPRENRWWVMAGYEASQAEGSVFRFGGDRRQDYFVVRDRFGTSDEEVRFGPDEMAEAEAYAAERNRLEFQGPLDPEFTQRRDRLKKLAPDFDGWAFEGPPEARWPVRPGKYLVRDGGVGWHPESFDELAEDLGAVRAAIEADESNVYCVIDLDTGLEVPFDRRVSVEFS